MEWVVKWPRIVAFLSSRTSEKQICSAKEKSEELLFFLCHTGAVAGEVLLLMGRPPPHFLKQGSTAIGSCIKELRLPSTLLSLGDLGICSAAFGSYEPKKKEASHRNWTCVLLIMLLLPSGVQTAPFNRTLKYWLCLVGWRTGRGSQLHFSAFATLLHWGGWVLRAGAASHLLSGFEGAVQCSGAASSFAGITSKHLSTTWTFESPAFLTQLPACCRIPDLCAAAATTGFMSGFTTVFF